MKQSVEKPIICHIFDCVMPGRYARGRRLASAMGDLAATYSDLGRHSDALAMKESVLEFRRRVLPADHPDIGEGRVWSAAACSGLWL